MALHLKTLSKRNLAFHPLSPVLLLPVWCNYLLNEWYYKFCTIGYSNSKAFKMALDQVFSLCKFKDIYYVEPPGYYAKPPDIVVEK